MLSKTQINYQNPDYSFILKTRMENIKKLLADEAMLEGVKEHYRMNPWDFVSDWGWTYDPRVIALDRLPHIPFVLWPRQTEYLQWLYQMWRDQNDGLVEKSRDCGVTWLSVGFAVCLWLFEPGFVAGFGSRKKELVDDPDDPDSIFVKIRYFIEHLPKVLMPRHYLDGQHSKSMLITNPDNGSTILGEGGDQIGRGGRASIYFVDEAGFIVHQELVDRALSQNTNCKIDISTYNGNGNAFYRKSMKLEGTKRKFIFDWKQDPRKDQAWYDKQCDEKDSVAVAQEIDRDPNASQEDSFIPAQWVQSAIDAHLVLGFEPTGMRVSAFDPADVGDPRAVVNRHGSVIQEADQKTDGDITQAIPWAFHLADDFRAEVLAYDGDGMGAPTMKQALQARAATRMRVMAYHGSAGVVDPMQPLRKKRLHQQYRQGKGALTDAQDIVKTNADTYLNFLGQTWSWARDRFEMTHEAVTLAKAGKLVNANPDDLVSISSQCRCLLELTAELSRPKKIYNKNGKIEREHKKDMKARGVKSPNLADACIIALSVNAPDMVGRAQVDRKKVRVKTRVQRRAY